jgi:phage terminase small subunit
MEEPKLNPKQILFAQAYAKHGNATQAYLEAGYKVSEKVAQVNASKLLLNPMVHQFVQKLQKPALKKAEVTIERITAELAKIAFGDLSDVVDVESGRVKLKDNADLSLVDGISFNESNGQAGYSKGFSFKKSDKLKALDMLTKMIGGYDRSPDSDEGNLQSNAGRILSALDRIRKKQ